MFKSALCLGTAIAMSLAAASSMAEEMKVEMLHFWTSGGEAAGVKVIQNAAAAKGVTWVDAAVAGGTGANATQVLRSRLASGTPPSGAQMHIQEMLVWANQNVLRDLSPLAKQGDWKNKLTPIAQPLYEVNGKWSAVPVTMHRSNWLWFNARVLKEAGIEPPKTWEEFDAAAQKLKAKGIIPLALGGQGWQYGNLMEAIMIGVGGPEFYRKVISGDEAAIKSPQMIATFDRLAKLRGDVDPNSPGRDWNLATAMMINGEAAFQIMGDWAKAEFEVAGKKYGDDFGCVPAPDTATDYIWMIDNFAFFNSRKPGVEKGQEILANTVLEPEVQVLFANQKGSIPVITQFDVKELDACGQQSFSDREKAEASNRAVPSIFYNSAMPAANTGVFLDVVSEFFVTPSMTSQQAVNELISGLEQL